MSLQLPFVLTTAMMVGACATQPPIPDWNRGDEPPPDPTGPVEPADPERELTEEATTGEDVPGAETEPEANTSVPPDDGLQHRADGSCWLVPPNPCPPKSPCNPPPPRQVPCPPPQPKPPTG